MQLILMVVEAIGLVVGSLAAAVLLCWFLWHAFQLVLHPEWGISVVLILVVLALIGELPSSQFLDMTLTFAVVAAVPLWFAGRAWRKPRQQALSSTRPQGVLPLPSEPVITTQSAQSLRLYPAITA